MQIANAKKTLADLKKSAGA